MKTKTVVTAAQQSATNTSVATTVLTTGDKVGIGVGVAGGVCLLAAAALLFFILRRRRNRQSNEPDYTQVDNNEKWQGQAYPAEAPGSSDYNDPGFFRGSYRGAKMVHEAGYTPQEERSIRRTMSPHPQELDAGTPIAHEMESNAGTPRQAGSPAPEYRERL